MSEYDVIVIGGGPAGENAADYAVRGSDRTALLVEGELLGGECSYFACIPSKALLRPLDVIGAARHLQGVAGRPAVDRRELLARRDAWVSQYDDSGQAEWAHQAGLEVRRGTGRLVGERQVEVTGADGAGTEVVTARHAVVLATGSVPVLPEPLRAVRAWTSRDATGVVEVPDRLAVVGGGVVACEAARWMAALGSAVTMLVRGDRLLDRAEPFAGQAVLASLRDGGVEVRLETGVEDARRDDPDDRGLGRLHGGPVTLALAGGKELEVDEVLAATGRRPATEGLGLETVGVDPQALDGPLPHWLHAVGDVSGEAPLTHWGKYRAREAGLRVAARAEGRPEPVAHDAPVPQVVFTEPQVAWVGPTAEQARADGRRVHTLDADYASAAGAALLRDDAHGQARLVVDPDSGVLLGATFVGPDVAELLHSATVAVTGGLTLDVLRHAVPSFPTASEVWLRLLEAEPEQ